MYQNVWEIWSLSLIRLLRKGKDKETIYDAEDMVELDTNRTKRKMNTEHTPRGGFSDRSSVTKNNGLWIGWLDLLVLFICNQLNNSESMTVKGSLHSLLDYECHFFYCDWLFSDLRIDHFYEWRKTITYERMTTIFSLHLYCLLAYEWMTYESVTKRVLMS
jgi:hypothetical protein